MCVCVCVCECDVKMLQSFEDEKKNCENNIWCQNFSSFMNCNLNSAIVSRSYIVNFLVKTPMSDILCNFRLSSNHNVYKILFENRSLIRKMTKTQQNLKGW